MVRLLRLERRKAQEKIKRKIPPKKHSCFMVTVGRSVGWPVFPAVSSAGWRVCYLHTITPPPVPLPTQHPTYATIATASLVQCTAVASKNESVILLKDNASITLPPSGRAPLTPLPRNARDFRPVFCPYFCYWPAAARHHPGFQPLSPPSNLHSPPVQLVPRRTLRGGSGPGGLVRLFLHRHSRPLWFSLYSLHTKNRLSCGVASFSFKSTREDSIVVVSVMACHLPAWPPVSTTGASLMASSSTVAAWLLAIAHFGATVAGQSVMGLRPCSTSQCWLSIPTWNLNLQLGRIAIQKWRQQRPRICSVRSLCVAFVALALVFVPGLYSTAYRATFPSFLCGSSSLFLLFV